MRLPLGASFQARVPPPAPVPNNEIVVFAVVHCEDSSAKATFPYRPNSGKNASEPAITNERYWISQLLENQIS
jgi:hypothetical protein